MSLYISQPTQLVFGKHDELNSLEELEQISNLGMMEQIKPHLRLNIYQNLVGQIKICLDPVQCALLKEIRMLNRPQLTYNSISQINLMIGSTIIRRGGLILKRMMFKILEIKQLFKEDFQQIYFDHKPVQEHMEVVELVNDFDLSL